MPHSLTVWGLRASARLSVLPGGMVDAPSFEAFWQNTFVPVFCMVAVHAQDLEAFWIPLIAKPFVKSHATFGTYHLPVFIPVIVHVIDS